jgi:hypothetical protein
MQQNLDQEISRRLIQKIYEGLLNSTVEKTRESYGAGLLRFTQFCDREAISESARMPASAVLLAAFIADAVGTVTGSAIRNWISGLQLWHLYNLAEWNGRDQWVPSLKKTAEKQGAIFKRAPRGPITLEHLIALRRCLDLSKPRDAAIWAAALVAFWACRRLGELLPISAKKFDLIHDVSRSAQCSREIVQGRIVISFHLPWTKTTGIAGGQCIVTQTSNEYCPVWALDNHFSVNGTPDKDTPMFAYRQERSDGSQFWSTLTKAVFLDVTSAAFKADSKLQVVFGHSYRIGGALCLLLIGVAPEFVAKIGGWTSLCFLIYWRRLEQIIPKAIATAWDKQIKEYAERNKIRMEGDVDSLDLFEASMHTSGLGLRADA